MMYGDNNDVKMKIEYDVNMIMLLLVHTKLLCSILVKHKQFSNDFNGIDSYIEISIKTCAKISRIL